MLKGGKQAVGSLVTSNIKHPWLSMTPAKPHSAFHLGLPHWQWDSDLPYT